MPYVTRNRLLNISSYRREVVSIFDIGRGEALHPDQVINGLPKNMALSQHVCHFFCEQRSSFLFINILTVKLNTCTLFITIFCAMLNK